MKRKYPMSMFAMGVILNLIKSWYFLIVIFLFSIISIISHNASFVLPLAVTIVWLLYAFITQLRHRKAVLRKSENESLNELYDKMFADNQKGYRNIIDTVDDIIKDQDDE